MPDRVKPNLNHLKRGYYTILRNLLLLLLVLVCFVGHYIYFKIFQPEDNPVEIYNKLNLEQLEHLASTSQDTDGTLPLVEESVDIQPVQTVSPVAQERKEEPDKIIIEGNKYIVHGSASSKTKTANTISQIRTVDQTRWTSLSPVRHGKISSTNLVASNTNRSTTILKACDRKPVCVVALFAPWCSACKRSIPKFQQFRSQYTDASISFVAIISGDKDIEKLKKMAKSVGSNALIDVDLNFSTLMDDKITAWPTWWAIDDNGNIIGTQNSGSSNLNRFLTELGIVKK